MASEKRRASRAGAVDKVRISYVDDQGRQHFEMVAAQDISARGCQVVLKFRCPVRTVVALNLSPANSGNASVRYQNPTPRGYVTGLEFLGGLEPRTATGE
ncbi:MAG: hypothetical protein ACKV2U_25275 [Bryobacteraceae bacterium]